MCSLTKHGDCHCSGGRWGERTLSCPRRRNAEIDPIIHIVTGGHSAGDIIQHHTWTPGSSFQPQSVRRSGENPLDLVPSLVSARANEIQILMRETGRCDERENRIE